MKVYVITFEMSYEGETIHCVTSTLDKAREYVKSLDDINSYRYIIPWNNGVESYARSKNICDGYYIQEYEVI